MSDSLHIEEIMTFLKGRNDSQPSIDSSKNDIMMIGDIANDLGPQEMGLCGPVENRLQAKVLSQFKVDCNLTCKASDQSPYDLNGTVLTDCIREPPCNIQPCYCSCELYRRCAHSYFYCDVCKRIPIGTMYACGKCAEVVYNECTACHAIKTHPCGTMEEFKVPMTRQEFCEHYERWQQQTKNSWSIWQWQTIIDWLGA